MLHGGVLLAAPGVWRGGEPDVHDLVAAGAGDEGFGARGEIGEGVGGDGDVGGAGAAAEGGAELEGLLVGVGDGVDGDASCYAIAYDERVVVWRDARDAGAFSGSGDGDLAALVEVDHAYGVGAGVGHVGALAIGCDFDEVRFMVDADGGGYLIVGGVDYADGVAVGVDRVDLVEDGVGRHAGGIAADLKDAVLAQVDEVEHGYCI